MKLCNAFVLSTSPDDGRRHNLYSSFIALCVWVWLANVKCLCLANVMCVCRGEGVGAIWREGEGVGGLFGGKVWGPYGGRVRVWGTIWRAISRKGEVSHTHSSSVQIYSLGEKRNAQMMGMWS